MSRHSIRFNSVQFGNAKYNIKVVKLKPWHQKLNSSLFFCHLVSLCSKSIHTHPTAVYHQHSTIFFPCVYYTRSCSFILSCMHWDVSCKVHPSIQKHHWEITFDLHSHYYIDLYEQTLTSELNRMENSVRACTEMCTIKVGNYFSLLSLLFYCCSGIGFMEYIEMLRYIYLYKAATIN